MTRGRAVRMASRSTAINVSVQTFDCGSAAKIRTYGRDTTEGDTSPLLKSTFEHVSGTSFIETTHKPKPPVEGCSSKTWIHVLERADLHLGRIHIHPSSIHSAASAAAGKTLPASSPRSSTHLLRSLPARHMQHDESPRPGAGHGNIHIVLPDRQERHAAVARRVPGRLHHPLLHHVHGVTRHVHQRPLPPCVAVAGSCRRCPAVLVRRRVAAAVAGGASPGEAGYRDVAVAPDKQAVARGGELEPLDGGPGRNGVAGDYVVSRSRRAVGGEGYGVERVLAAMPLLLLSGRRPGDAAAGRIGTNVGHVGEAHGAYRVASAQHGELEALADGHEFAGDDGRRSPRGGGHDRVEAGGRWRVQGRRSQDELHLGGGCRRRAPRGGLHCAVMVTALRSFLSSCPLLYLPAAWRLGKQEGVRGM